MTPLTPAQRELAADPKVIRRAAKFALWWARTRRCGHRADEVVSAAYLGLVDAAARYDGSVRWWTFAFPRVRGAVLDWARSELPAGFRRRAAAAPATVSLSAPAPDGGRRESLATTGAGVDPVGWELESLDELRHHTRGLTRKEGAAVRLLYGHAATPTMAAVGRAMGVTGSEVSRLVAGAFAFIRSRETK